MGKLIEKKDLRDKLSVFKDRAEAGAVLAEMLRSYKGTDAIVFAIPSGGVPVAKEIAVALGLPMDLAIARKIQIPHNPEAGFGAIGPDGTTVINEPLLLRLGLTGAEVETQIKKALEGVKRRERIFRSDANFPNVAGKTVIVVDDGLASGYTMLAALRFVKKRNPSRLVAAVPTASKRAAEFILPDVDELYCPNIRSGFTFAVADAYEKWHDLSEDEVISILKELESA